MISFYCKFTLQIMFSPQMIQISLSEVHHCLPSSSSAPLTFDQGLNMSGISHSTHRISICRILFFSTSMGGKKSPKVEEKNLLSFNNLLFSVLI